MSTQIVNIHDSFFKQALSDPQLARVFLHEHLPTAVSVLLEDASPILLPVSVVDEDLRQHHFDLLFKVPLNTGSDALAYVLVEHKSVPEEMARLQLLRYIVRILIKLHNDNAKRLPLPVVVPLLVHQGPGHWKISCEFADLFGSVPAALQSYIPSFRHALVNLPEVDDHALSGQTRLRASLKALKYCRRPDLPERIEDVLADAPLLEDRDLEFILTYLNKSPIKVSRTLLREALRRLVPERMEKIMGNFSQPYFEEGRTEGRAEEAANMLVRLLNKRFGTLSPQFRERIFTADVVTVEDWIEHVFDAPDLQSIFGAN